MINKVLVNDKDIRLEYKNDSGISIDNYIDRGLDPVDEIFDYEILEYIKYLENKLVEKYNEIDTLLDYENSCNRYEAAEAYDLLEEDYCELYGKYNNLEEENDKLVDKILKLKAKLRKESNENI